MRKTPFDLIQINIFLLNIRSLFIYPENFTLYQPAKENKSNPTNCENKNNAHHYSDINP